MSENPADPSSSATSGTVAPASLTPLALRCLDQTWPWVRFMSVLTFVGGGLMGLMSVARLVASVLGLGGLSVGDGAGRSA